MQTSKGFKRAEVNKIKNFPLLLWVVLWLVLVAWVRGSLPLSSFFFLNGYHVTLAPMPYNYLVLVSEKCFLHFEEFRENTKKKTSPFGVSEEWNALVSLLALLSKVLSLKKQLTVSLQLYPWVRTKKCDLSNVAAPPCSPCLPCPCCPPGDTVTAILDCTTKRL